MGPEFHFHAVNNRINAARAKNGIRMPDGPPCSSVTVLRTVLPSKSRITSYIADRPSLAALTALTQLQCRIPHYPGYF